MTTTIKRHNTAIKRKVHSVPAKWAIEQALVRGQVFDFGCGRGDDVRLFNEDGIKATGFDPYHAPENDPSKFDFSKVGTLFCNYVLNVIENPKERTALVGSLIGAFRQMPRFSKMIVAVRSKTEIETEAKKKGWTPYKGGYITPTKTFQKGFTARGIKNLLNRNGLNVAHVEAVSGGFVALVEKE
jgi:DNA phosphorothioation-associated putative methyltransferase